jgi:hypothetical protein
MLIQTLSVRGTFALVLAGLLFASSAAVAQQAIPRDLSVEQVPIAEIGATRTSQCWMLARQERCT